MMGIEIDGLDLDTCSQESLDILASRPDFAELVAAAASTQSQADAVLAQVTETQACADLEPHAMHYWETFLCQGIPWIIEEPEEDVTA